MLKNLCDVAIVSIAWWAVGHAFAFEGGSVFIGYSPGNFFLGNDMCSVAGSTCGYEWVHMFFQFNFAATSSTIVSGAIAERAYVASYLLHSLTFVAIIYPVVGKPPQIPSPRIYPPGPRVQRSNVQGSALWRSRPLTSVPFATAAVHWEWSSSGWVSPTAPSPFSGGVIDFAGCGAVHLAGGVAACAGAKLIGPRRGRFEEDRRLPPIPMPGHSSVLQVLGVFILWVGWYGFNAGSIGYLNAESAKSAGRITMTTTVRPASAP